MDDKPQGTKPVTLIPIKWEWECPKCGSVMEEYDAEELVTCNNRKCKISYFTNFHKKD